jgi:thiol-disulfide isomerase/thioredoxin
MDFSRLQFPSVSSLLSFFVKQIIGKFKNPFSPIPPWRRLVSGGLMLVALASFSLMLGTPSALASLEDDRYDGNVFVLYAGNGSLVPPPVTLAQALKEKKPTLLVFYVDDSSDCKKHALTVSQLQAFYGRAARFLPIDIDVIPVKSSYEPTEPGYYYKGLVPQTVLIDQEGEVVFDRQGLVAFERVDDVFREVFNLLPRSESPDLKRYPINEFNSELSK